jgi:pyruvate-formate lyase-activating enzyme
MPRITYKFQEFSLVDAPNSCAIIFSQGCTFSCKYCYNIELRNFNSDGFSFEEIINKIQSLLKINPKGKEYNTVDWLILSGGEPFSNPDINKILEFAKKQKLKTGIYTSGISSSLREYLDLNLIDFLNIDYKHYNMKYLGDEVENYLFDLIPNIEYAYNRYLNSKLEYLYLNTVICKSIHTKEVITDMKNILLEFDINPPILYKRDYSKNFGWILTSFFNDNDKIPTLGNLTIKESVSEQELKLLI